MLFLEGFYYALMTIGVVILFGIPISYIGVIAYADVLSFFTYKFRILPILICLPIITGIAFIIPRLAYGNIKNDSIVERLREAE